MDEDKKPENTTDLWIPLFLSMLALNKPQPKDDTMIEKEISYLQGKVDVLEKIILRR